MTTTTLIQTHEIITIFLSGITFCSKGSSFYSKHTMEMEPILQSNLSQLTISEISFALFLPCLLSCQCWSQPLITLPNRAMALGRCPPKHKEVLNKPQKLGCSYKYSSILGLKVNLISVILYSPISVVLHYQL